jgi:predicted amidohydrolase YtcJ
LPTDDPVTGPLLHPDLVLLNGRVTTGIAGDPEAVAIGGGRILATGPDRAVRPLVGPGTQVLDLNGSRVIPGLIDSHIHVVRAGLTWTERLDWSGTTSLTDALASITAAAETVPAGSWIMVVGGWHPGRFSEQRGPTVAELTAAAPDHPVYLQLLYEEAWVNRAGLAALGMDKTTPDPAGGSFERSADGTPTGSLRGPGAFGFCIRAAADPSFESQVESSRTFFSQLNRLGLTGTIDTGGFGMTPESYRPLYELWRRRRLTLKTRLFIMPSSPGDELDQIRDLVHHLHPGFGDEMLRLVGLGEIPLFACWDAEGVRPFQMTPDAKRHLKEIVLLLARNGWPLHQHAIFDSTISDVLDVWEEVDSVYPIADHRYALAHAEPIGDVNLQRVKRLGAGIAVQSRMPFRAADSADLWGEEALTRAPPLRRILDLGIPLGAGTDATAVSPYNPWFSMWWLVTGRSLDGAPPRSPEHRLSRAEALTAYTRGSAWFSHDENSRGTLAPGMAADLAVLSRDYFTIEEEDIPSLRSVLTIVDGRIAHAEPGLDLNVEGEKQ